MDPPDTSYVVMGGSDVAYKVLGDGPLDLLYCYGLGGHVELLLEILHGAGSSRTACDHPQLRLADILPS